MKVMSFNPKKNFFKEKEQNDNETYKSWVHAH